MVFIQKNARNRVDESNEFRIIHLAFTDAPTNPKPVFCDRVIFGPKFWDCGFHALRVYKVAVSRL